MTAHKALIVHLLFPLSVDQYGGAQLLDIKHWQTRKGRIQKGRVKRKKKIEKQKEEPERQAEKKGLSR